MRSNVMNGLANRPRYRCPCCGFMGLDVPAYEQLCTNVLPRGFTVPYCRHFGAASYDVCICCGFEFGYDDEPGASVGSTFEEHLAKWLADGAVWFYPDKKPPGWTIEEQM